MRGYRSGGWRNRAAPAPQRGGAARRRGPDEPPSDGRRAAPTRRSASRSPQRGGGAASAAPREPPGPRRNEARLLAATERGPHHRRTPLMPRVQPGATAPKGGGSLQGFPPWRRGKMQRRSYRAHGAAQACRTGARNRTHQGAGRARAAIGGRGRGRARSFMIFPGACRFFVGGVEGLRHSTPPRCSLIIDHSWTKKWGLTLCQTPWYTGRDASASNTDTDTMRGSAPYPSKAMLS